MTTRRSASGSPDGRPASVSGRDRHPGVRVAGDHLADELVERDRLARGCAAPDSSSRARASRSSTSRSSRSTSTSTSSMSAAQSAAGPSRCADLELHPQRRERRAQLVRGVADEGALPAGRRVDAVEHRVQRHGQPVDLVLRRGHRQPLLGQPGRGDVGGAVAQRRDRAQRQRDDAVGSERHQQHRERAADQGGPGEDAQAVVDAADVGRRPGRSGCRACGRAPADRPSDVELVDRRAGRRRGRPRAGRA